MISEPDLPKSRSTAVPPGSRTAWLLRPLATVFVHWDLFARLLVRDLQAGVRGSILGAAWIVISPLVLVAVYTFVFGAVLDSAWTAGAPSPLEVPLIYYVGIAVFGFFMEILLRAPEAIRVNKTYVTKIVFPVEVLDWILVVSAAAKLGVSLALILGFLAIVAGGIPVAVLWIPWIVLPSVLLGVGLAWFVSGVGTYVRDVGPALVALAPVLMFMSPIFYSVDQVPEGVRWVYAMNPATFVIESLRDVLFFERGLSLADYSGYWLGSLAVFYSGYWFFSRARRGFADVI